MSTRGWYEYYVLDETTGTMSLSMQFYKWGDATPLNALCELGEFKQTLQKLEGTLPVFLLDEMLRDQLGAAYQHLPHSFSVGCYLFFLQRETEEQSSFKRSRYQGNRMSFDQNTITYGLTSHWKLKTSNRHAP